MLCWPRGVSSRGRNDSIRRHNDFIDLKFKTATWTLWTSHASESTGKKVTELARRIEPDYQEAIVLLLHNGSKGNYIWNIGDPLVLSCPVRKVKEKL